MARIRQVKPEFFRHEELYELEKHCALPVRIAFCGLWTACDRSGRFRWKPRQLKLDVLPYDDLDFESVLSALESKSFVISYIVDGEKYGYIPSWDKHQQPHIKEKVSTLPAPCKNSSITPDSGVRILDNGLRNTVAPDTPDSLAHWVANELRISKPAHKISCSEQIRLAMLAGEDGKTVTERMITNGPKFRDGPHFKYGGWGKYFDDGLWNQNGSESVYDRIVNEANKQLADE